MTGVIRRFPVICAMVALVVGVQAGVFLAGYRTAVPVVGVGLFLLGCSFGRWFSARRQVAAAVAAATATAHAQANNRQVTVIGHAPAGRPGEFDDLGAIYDDVFVDAGGTERHDYIGPGGTPDDRYHGYDDNGWSAALAADRAASHVVRRDGGDGPSGDHRRGLDVRLPPEGPVT